MVQPRELEFKRQYMDAFDLRLHQDPIVPNLSVFIQIPETDKYIHRKIRVGAIRSAGDVDFHYLKSPNDSLIEECDLETAIQEASRRELTDLNYILETATHGVIGADFMEEDNPLLQNTNTNKENRTYAVIGVATYNNSSHGILTPEQVELFKAKSFFDRIIASLFYHQKAVFEVITYHW